MPSMVTSHPQRQFLRAGSPTNDWTTRPDSCDEFWPHAGNLQGIHSSILQRGDIDADRRRAVATCIQNQYHLAGIEPNEALDAFGRGAEAVTVGHQLQAGGGPAFFHYKIMSALRWAKRLQSEGVDAVAVFWMASEDHDFEEVSQTFGTALHAFSWRPERSADGPVGRIAWDESAENDWAAWCREMGVHSQRVQTPLPLAHRVRHWLQEWFPGEPLVVIDGDDVELKALAGEVLKAEWTDHGIASALAQQMQTYEARWGDSPLRSRSNNLFVLEESGARLRADRWMDQHSVEEGLALSPQAWSPNAALRPLYQEQLLQSAAFLGGPSEIGYWLLLGAAFNHHKISHPALLVRDGALVFDADAEQAAKAVDWTPQQGAVKGEVAVAQWADKGINGKGELELAFVNWTEALIHHAEGIPGDAVPTTKAALARMEKELVQVQKKWRKLWKQQHAHEAESIQRAFDEWLCPSGGMQERKLSALVAMQAAGGREAFAEKWYKALKGMDEPQFLVFHPEG